MRISPVVALLASAFLLFACDYYPPPVFEKTTAPPPPEGTASTSARAAEPAPARVSGDGTTVWIKEGVEDSQRRADIDDCYGYAKAQVRRELRIQEDRVAAGRTSGIGGEEKFFRARMDRFETGRQFEILFGRCMRAKGYNQG